MTDKEKREKFGVVMAPVEATTAYKKPMEHFQAKGIDAWSWVLVDAASGTVVYVNTYGGKAGRKWKPKPLKLSGEKLQKKIKQYEQCPIEECPVAANKEDNLSTS